MSNFKLACSRWEFVSVQKLHFGYLLWKIQKNKEKYICIDLLPHAHSHAEFEISAFCRFWEISFMKKIEFVCIFWKKYQKKLYMQHMLFALRVWNSENCNKKDGYRQQNVRQRQKLISIIDYDVCVTFY